MPITPPPLLDPEAIGKEIDRLTRDVEKLRFSYEQYFLGLQKNAPTQERTSLTRLIAHLSGAAIPNARMKFRLQQTIARYNAFSTYWNRILKDIEDGKHQRDLFRAKLHEQPTTNAPTVPKSTEGAKATSDPYAVLYQQYISARTKCNEPTQGLTLDGFRKTMTTQLKSLQQKTSGSFRFQVAIEGGKSKIKAIPQATPTKKS